MTDAATLESTNPMEADENLVGRFHRVLVESIRDEAPAYLDTRFTVAEIYQSLVPYRTHRDRLGLAMNGDYEDTLLRLLAGEGDFLILESDPARKRIRKEIDSRNPNTGIYREFAAAEVRLNPHRLSDLETSAETRSGSGNSGDSQSARPAHADDESKVGLAGGGAEERESASPSLEKPEPGAQPQETLSCPDCGEALPDRESLRFCPHCGTNILEVPCASCDEVLDRGWRFCVACGAPTNK